MLLTERAVGRDVLLRSEIKNDRLRQIELLHR